jgi:plastocyanin
MKNVLLILALILIIATGSLVILSKSSGKLTPSRPKSQMMIPNSINIKNFSFNPATLTVKPGTVVTWNNYDSVMHSVKSSIFNSAALNTNDTFKFTFNSPGIYTYGCGIHPTMTGTIIVEQI